MSFSRWYRHWTTLLSLLVVLPGGVAPLAGMVAAQRGALTMTIVGGLFLSFLFVRALRDGPERTGPIAPHALTALRGVAAVVLLGAIAAGGSSLAVSGWTAAALLALVETTDFLDGRLARKVGYTEFGSIWDMETDAFFTYSLSYSLWVIRSAVPAVLLIGGMRYLYFLLFRVEGDPPVHPRSYKLFAKTVAALLVVVLILGHLPVMSLSTVNALVIVVLLLQVSSFGWDFLLQIRSRRVRKTHI